MATPRLKKQYLEEIEKCSEPIINKYVNGIDPNQTTEANKQNEE